MNQLEKDARSLSDRELLLQVHYRTDGYEKKFESLEKKLSELQLSHVRLEVQARTKATMWGAIAAIITSIIAGVGAGLLETFNR